LNSTPKEELTPNTTLLSFSSLYESHLTMGILTTELDVKSMKGNGNFRNRNFNIGLLYKTDNRSKKG
jgi:hypothetical protein